MRSILWLGVFYLLRLVQIFFFYFFFIPSTKLQRPPETLQRPPPPPFCSSAPLSIANAPQGAVPPTLKTSALDSRWLGVHCIQKLNV